MRHLFYLLILGITFLSCTGPVGPQGIAGPQGTALVGQTYEYTVNFTPANNYGATFTFNQDIYNSDVVLAYRLDGQDKYGNDIWRQVPLPVYLTKGTLSYEFNFTKRDVLLYVDAGFDLGFSESQWLLDQVFRIVVVPSDFVSNRQMSYKQMMTELKMDESDFVKP